MLIRQVRRVQIMNANPKSWQCDRLLLWQSSAHLASFLISLQSLGDHGMSECILFSGYPRFSQSSLLIRMQKSRRMDEIQRPGYSICDQWVSGQLVYSNAMRQFSGFSWHLYKTPLAESKSQSLMAPFAAPATTSSSGQSRATDSTAVVCPARL